MGQNKSKQEKQPQTIYVVLKRLRSTFMHENYTYEDIAIYDTIEVVTFSTDEKKATDIYNSLVLKKEANWNIIHKYLIQTKMDMVYEPKTENIYPALYNEHGLINENCIKEDRINEFYLCSECHSKCCSKEEDDE